MKLIVHFLHNPRVHPSQGLMRFALLTQSSREVDETCSGTTEPSVQRCELRRRDPTVQLRVVMQLCAAGEVIGSVEAIGRDVRTGQLSRRIQAVGYCETGSQAFEVGAVEEAEVLGACVLALQKTA